MYREWRLNTIQFSEYVFHIMKNASKEKIKELGPDNFKIFKNDRTIRRFADNKSLDERLMMLILLGQDVGLTIAPLSKDINDILLTVKYQYDSPQKRLETIESMAKEKVFMVASKQFLDIINMGAQNSISKTYVLDYGYLKVHDALGRQQAGDSSTEIIRKSIKGTDLIAKLALQVFTLSDEHVNTLTGVNKKKIMVLLAMFAYRDTYVSPKVLLVDTMLQTSKGGIGRIMRSLELEGYCSRLKSTRDRAMRSVDQVSYTIELKGIDVVNRFVKYISNKTVKS